MMTQREENKAIKETIDEILHCRRVAQTWRKRNKDAGKPNGRYMRLLVPLRSAKQTDAVLRALRLALHVNKPRNNTETTKS